MHTSLLCLPPSSPGWRTLRPPLRPVPPFLLSWILLPGDALMRPTPGMSLGARMQLFLLQSLVLPALLEERDDKEKPGMVVSCSLSSCAGLRLSLEPGSGAHYWANAGSSPAGASTRISQPEGRSVHLGGTEAASCCSGACSWQGGSGPLLAPGLAHLLACDNTGHSSWFSEIRYYLLGSGWG